MSGPERRRLPVIGPTAHLPPERRARVMRTLRSTGIAASLVLGGCAVLPQPAELSTCLQPNRRVDVEVSGVADRPQPGFAAASRSQMRPIRFEAIAQGDGAFDVGAAVLKDEGRSDFDRLAIEIDKRKVRVGSIVVIGHTDRLEAERFPPSLSEERAKAVVAYLHSKGMDKSLMFWEGKGAGDPLPVTRFCD